MAIRGILRFLAIIGVVAVATRFILERMVALEPSDLIIGAALFAALGAVVTSFVPRWSTFAAAFLGVFLAMLVLVWDTLIDYGGGTNALIFLAPLLYVPVFLGAGVGLIFARHRRRTNGPAN